MFDDDTNHAKAIAFVFGGSTLPRIGRELQSQGATVAQGECSDCGGTIYNHGYEVICGECSLVVGSNTRTNSKTAWEYFHENRSTYHNSNRGRLPGGFPSAYDWVERDDIDHPVKQLDPELFYDG